jgi:hypothetical protein
LDEQAVPIFLNLVVAPDGIRKWSSDFGDPDFDVLGRPFASWMTANHPDIVEAGTVGFGNWTTTEDAEQNGILSAQYAAEWAAYLIASGCEYDDGC